MVAPLLALTLLASTWPADLQPLVNELRDRGFRLRLEAPPVPRTYGLYDPRTRTLWVSPLSVELGIGRQTLLHEAVHAAQSCPRGMLTPIGWRFQLSPVVEREISHLLINGYQHHRNRVLEREAFGLQGQPKTLALLLSALRQRCPLRPAS